MKKYLCLLYCCLHLTAHAQTNTDSTRQVYNKNERRIALVAAYNGLSYQYAELGIGYNEYGVAGHHPYGWAFSASCEMRVDKPTLLAPKLSAWIAGGSAFGVNLLYYTAPEQKGSLCLRPEIGIGMWKIKLTYGYNFALTNKTFTGINRHCLNFTFMVPVVKIKSREF